MDRRPVGDLVLGSVHRADAGHGDSRRPTRLCRLGVQLAPRFQCLRSSAPHRLTRPTSAPFRVGQTPVSGRLSGTIGGGADHHVPVSRCLSAAGIRFLGLPVPAGELSSPRGRPTGHRHRHPDPDGVTALRTYEIRLGWAPPIPREPRCPTVAGRVPQPPRAASQRPVPGPRNSKPPAGAVHDEASTRGSLVFARPAFPFTCGPRMERAPLGLTP